MTDLVAAPMRAAPCRIEKMGEDAIEKVRRLERLARSLPQVPLDTEHLIHAGLYARTLRVPAGVTITGTLIKVATVLIVAGEGVVFVDSGPVRLSGYTVVPASAGRKQAFVAESDLHLTMIFASDAKDIDQAERQFTDEVERLGSRGAAGRNHITITGD